MRALLTSTLYLLLLIQCANHLASCEVLNLEHTGSTDSVHEKNGVNNLTNNEIADAMRAKGYRVMQFANRLPLAIVGDTARPPEQIVPELFGEKRRMSSVTSGRLWKDRNGKSLINYYYDTESWADQKLFQKAVKTWSDETCIRFTRMRSTSCHQYINGYAVCVGNFNGCWSIVGKEYSQENYPHPPQLLSVEPGGCELTAAVHEFGHTIGNLHTMSRPDRDQFIHVNFRNFDVGTRGADKDVATHWAQAERCYHDQVVDLPLPYDYLSVMQYKAAAFGDVDQRPIFVTKKGRHQYLLDYHRSAGMTQTHYDLYAVNTVYGCDKVWIRWCHLQHRSPPKCRNLGYVGKDCRCHCPRAFSGPACEQRVGEFFPLMAKVAMETVRTDQTVDFRRHRMLPERLDGRLDKFRHYQYITLILNGRPDTKASIFFWRHGVIRALMMYDFAEEFATYAHYLDCAGGLRLFWGISQHGNMRTECFSTVWNNDFEAPVFRSRTNHLDLIGDTSLGMTFNDPRISIAAVQLTMDVVFGKRPSKHLTVRSTLHEHTVPEVANGSLTRVASPADRADRVVLGFGIAFSVLLLLAVVVWAISLCPKPSSGKEESATERLE